MSTVSMYRNFMWTRCLADMMQNPKFASCLNVKKITSSKIATNIIIIIAGSSMVVILFLVGMFRLSLLELHEHCRFYLKKNYNKLNYPGRNITLQHILQW